MSFDLEGNDSQADDIEPGGLIGATREPLWQALSAGLSTAATILAIVFLASGAVRLEAGTAVFGLALAGFAVAAALAPVWLSAGRLHRTRTTAIAVSLALAAIVAVRGLMSLLPFAAPSAPAGAPDVLLVTLDGDGSASASAPGNGDWQTVRALPSSRRLDAALASLLTGLESIEHRVLFQGDALPERASTIGEILGRAGFETALFGALKLPRWAGRGFGFVSERKSLDEALAWLGENGDAPRFAHVHAGPAGVRAIAERAQTYLARGGVAIIAIPTGETLWWGRRAGRPLVPGVRSATSVVPTILDETGVTTLDKSADAPTLFERPAPLTVTLDHGIAGAVHNLRATFASGALDIELTPLGGHPTDDWSLDEALQSHFVYRNGVQVVGSSLDDSTPEKRQRVHDWLERIRAWRRRNGSFEAAIAH